MQLSNRHIITVSELARDARDLLESEFPALFVEGEMSNLSQPSSGHWYFTLKDDRAQVRCAIFRNRNHMVRFEPRNGRQIIVRGRISFYEARGQFQLIADFLEEAGDGALRRAYEKLKADLQAEGLFAESGKKPPPPMPRHIAVVTSPTGAAIRDVLTVMGRRFPGIHASILPVQVQGEGSVSGIVRALAFANQYDPDPFDVILLARGGGSLEDLWSFNTEPVARAIAGSRIPVVSAVGHEADVTIADLVADLRAPTPSAGAELLTPDHRVWQKAFEDLQASLTTQMTSLLASLAQETNHLQHRIRRPEHRLQNLQQRADDLNRRLLAAMEKQPEGYGFQELERRLVAALENRVAHLKAKLTGLHLGSPRPLLGGYRTRLEVTRQRFARAEAGRRGHQQARLLLASEKLNTLSPLRTLKRGYAILLNAEQRVVADANQLGVGEKFTARLGTGEIRARVIDE